MGHYPGPIITLLINKNKYKRSFPLISGTVPQDLLPTPVIFPAETLNTIGHSTGMHAQGPPKMGFLQPLIIGEKMTPFILARGKASPIDGGSVMCLLLPLTGGWRVLLLRGSACLLNLASHSPPISTGHPTSKHTTEQGWMQVHH